jgi:hypothetical protein
MGHGQDIWPKMTIIPLSNVFFLKKINKKKNLEM